MESKKWPKIAISVAMIIVTVIIVIAAVLSLVLSDADYKEVSIRVVPASATVKIDGRYYPYKNALLKRGVHEVEVSKFGFETETRTVMIENDGESISVALSPNMTFTVDWYENDADDGTIYKQIMDDEKEAEMAQLLAEHPGVAALPVSGDGFGLDLSPCAQGYDWTPMCVRITADDYDGSVAAIEYFRQRIDSELGNYYFYYAGQPAAFTFYDVYSINDIPAPNYALSGDDGYALAVFTAEGLVYRTLYMDDGTGKYVLMGNPAPVLAYDNYLNVPKEIIRAANNVIVEE
ncbi:PEGA domain-containing protein [Candidatus Saccharibacteria bacterium]|nr:PEGA domain-containing protein [Candidatus Saccharibacteria bacterium]